MDDLQEFHDSFLPQQETCPNCGGKIIHDWEGDPDVVNGTRSFSYCENHCELEAAKGE